MQGLVAGRYRIDPKAEDIVEKASPRGEECTSTAIFAATDYRHIFRLAEMASLYITRRYTMPVTVAGLCPKGLTLQDF